MSELKIKDLLGYALESGSSDLHLSVGSYPMVRINGEMKKLQLPIMDLGTMESIRDEVLNDNQRKRFDEKLEIDFSTALEKKSFMVSATLTSFEIISSSSIRVIFLLLLCLILFVMLFL